MEDFCPILVYLLLTKSSFYHFFPMVSLMISVHFYIPGFYDTSFQTIYLRLSFYNKLSLKPFTIISKNALKPPHLTQANKASPWGIFKQLKRHSWKSSPTRVSEIFHRQNPEGKTITVLGTKIDNFITLLSPKDSLKILIYLFLMLEVSSS